ncbi:unannotated protein [freshwater metagenome]|uniref:Unannotated protein n=1 Tax=freshwater metagenome TaxID=449393 RepID=A0A6J5YTY4_9ZZZZ|nr:hypothetical protein [Actinomycetota bacterium]
MVNDGETPVDDSDRLSEAEKAPPRILEPVRTESGAFKALAWVVGGCLLVIVAVVVARAL